MKSLRLFILFLAFSCVLRAQSPVPLSPNSTTTATSVTTNLVWSAVSSASVYAVQISTKSDFSTLVAERSSITTNSIEGGFAYNTTYYWRVNATIGSTTGAWSSVASFFTESNGSFAIDFPFAFNERPYCFAITNNTLYVGGNFTRADPKTGGGRLISLSTGLADSEFPVIGGSVIDALPDGAGGWFVGGMFSSVGGILRQNIARITSDKTVDLLWNPKIEGYVYSMAQSGNTLFIGGQLYYVNGELRTGIAALDARTGDLLAWSPNPDYIVNKVAVLGNTLYVGGGFSTIAGQTRNSLAEFTISSGTLTSWNPNANDLVRTIEPTSDGIFVGGDFTSVGGSMRNYVAKLDPVTGTSATWNPNPNNSVRALAISGSTLYVAGYFSEIGGVARSVVAALDVISGTTSSWNAQGGGLVQALGITSGSVIVGGNFGSYGINPGSMGGTARNFLAMVNASSGLATSWNPSPNQEVRVIRVQGSSVFVGGDFSYIGGVPVTRNYLAAIDLSTNLLTSWNPGANAPIYSMAVTGNTIFVGSDYLGEVGGLTRLNIAAIDAQTGTTTTWNPGANASVMAMKISGSTLYVGGNFTQIGGQTRNRLAAIDITSGTVSSWNPNANELVRSIDIAGSTLFAGGNFTQIGGVSRNYLAGISLSDGTLTSFNPSPNDNVTGLAAKNGVVFAGGAFTQVNGGTSRNYIAAFDPNSGAVNGWNPTANSNIFNLIASGNAVYTSGFFTNIGGANRMCIAEVHATTGSATSWNPATSDYGYTNGLFAPEGAERLYAGGIFYFFGATYSPRFAILSTSLPPQFSPFTVTSPNGGEMLYYGSTATITWITTGATVSAVALEYSYNAGVSWETITNSTTNTGSFVWIVPYSATTRALIRVSDVANPNRSDQSNAIFTIYTPPIFLTPQSGSASILTSTTLSWTQVGNYSAFRLQISTDASFSTLAFDIANITSQSYSITGLGSNTTYFWRVQTTFGTITTPFSGVANFSTVCVAPLPVIIPSGSTSFCVGSSVNLGVNSSFVSYLWSNGATSASISVASSGTYSVSVLNASGCYGTSASITITVNPIPVITIGINGSSTFCVGENRILTATTSASYRWSNGATTQSISVVQSGTYSVTAASVAGCSSSASISVTAIPLPTPSVSGATLGIANSTGNIYSVTPHAGSTYFWSVSGGTITAGQGTSSVVIAWSAPTSATVFVQEISSSACVSTASIHIVVTAFTTALNLKVFLEGAYSTNSTMKTDLRTLGLLPLSDPYSIGVTTSSLPSGIVDWVRVELRPATNSTLTIFSTAALLRSDGRIVGLDGVNEVQIHENYLSAGNYFALVKHRNHLPVMSAQAITVATYSSTLFDFSTGQNKAWATFQTPMKELSAGVFGLFSGDLDGDGIINAADRIAVRNDSGGMGYLTSDCNFDGVVNSTDRVLVTDNRFRLQQIP